MTTKDKNKVIYLKSLFSKFKPTETLSEELKIEMAKLNLHVDAFSNKPLDPLADQRAGRKFILDNLDDFLNSIPGVEFNRDEFISVALETAVDTIFSGVGVVVTGEEKIINRLKGMMEFIEKES